MPLSIEVYNSSEDICFIKNATKGCRVFASVGSIISLLLRFRYELKTPDFHYEHHKNTEMLTSQDRWNKILDHRRPMLS